MSDAERNAPAVGSRVRIVVDEYPQLVGMTGTVAKVSADGVSAWVESAAPFGVWCSISDLCVTPPEATQP